MEDIQTSQMFNPKTIPKFKKKQTREKVVFVEIALSVQIGELTCFSLSTWLASKDQTRCLHFLHCSQFPRRRLFRSLQTLHCPPLHSHFETMWIILRLCGSQCCQVSLSDLQVLFECTLCFSFCLNQHFQSLSKFISMNRSQIV